MGSLLLRRILVCERGEDRLSGPPSLAHGSGTARLRDGCRRNDRRGREAGCACGGGGSVPFVRRRGACGWV